MRHELTCLIMVSMTATTSLAQSAPDKWDCMNELVEIGCSSDGCAISEEFTPMAVTSSPELLTVCAYTGCWEGVPDTHIEAGQFRMQTGSNYPFSTMEGLSATVAFTVDRVSGVATLIVSELFAHPMTCAPSVED